MKRKLALSAASILLTLLVAEAALRILGIGAAGRGSAWFAGGNHPRFLFQPDPESGYTLRPGFRGREIAPGNEFDVPAVIDARGLRDHPHPAPPHPCILAVGDSMTFGEGVPADRSYSAVLERTAGVRVYNGGVPGYSSRQMLVRLRRLAPKLRPDMVLMTLSPQWDRQRCATPFLYKEGYIVAQGYADRLVLLDGNLYLKDTRLPVFGPATAHAKRYSIVMRLALPALSGGVRALTRRSQPDHPSPEDYEPTVQNLAQARRFTEGMGARFLAVLIDDRGEEFRRDRIAVQKRLQELGIPYVAADDLVPGGGWSPLRFARDGHWNAAGHEAAGRALAGCVPTPSPAAPPPSARTSPACRP
jgi:lysophospholipase L1-like esterase